MQKYKIDILAIQETHLKGTGAIDIRTSDNKEVFDLYYTGPEKNSFHGVGVVVRKDQQADFKNISDRICMATIRLEEDKRDLHFIEPTCALCTVGSFVSLSVCPSVCLSGLDQKYWTIIHISKSIRAR